MPVPSSMRDLSTVAGSNSPPGSEAVGTSLDDYLRTIQSIIRNLRAVGVDVPAAATIDLNAFDAEFVRVTGTATVTSLGTCPAGFRRVLRFAGACTLTHSANLVLPMASNVSTVADGVYAFRSLGSGAWILEASTAIPAAQISDSTAAGRSLITAADAAAARTVLGLGNAATSALSTTNAAALGAAAPGVATTVARGDHVHPMPSAAAVGAEPAGAVNNRIQAGTVTGRYARWNNTTGRWEEFDLHGTANGWTATQTLDAPINRRSMGGAWMVQNLSGDGSVLRGGLWADDNGQRLVNAAFGAHVWVRTDNTVEIASDRLNVFARISRRVTGGGWILKNDSADGLTGRGGLWSDDNATSLVNEAFSAGVTTRADGSVHINGANGVSISGGVSMPSLTLGGVAQAQVVAGTATNRAMVWNNTTGRVEQGSDIEDSRGNLRAVPVNTQNGAYTFLAADNGRKVMKDGATTITYTLPTGLASGTTIIVRNKNAAGNITISRSGTTLRIAGVATNANATIAPWGEAVLHHENGEEWVISGTGVS